jgi:hypothetical protein
MHADPHPRRPGIPAAGQPRPSLLDFWFQPKRFETTRLYQALGARLLKRYVPTGGDLVMRRLRRRYPQAHLIGPAPEALRRFERWTRLAEAIHLAGFAAFAALTAQQAAAGSLSPAGLTVAVSLNLTLGLWPVVLQRYNRLRAYQAIHAAASRSTPRSPRLA